MSSGPLERIHDEVGLAGAELMVRFPEAAPIAIGWATVDLDRAAIELGRELGVAVTTFVPAIGSTALGASCRVASGVLPGGLSLALVEPETEGRLAYSLARAGEGPVAVWFAVAAADGVVDETPGVEIRLSSVRPGPFGPERLLLDGPTHGPYRFLAGSAAGTIPA